MDLGDELALALTIADEVDAFTLPHFVDRDFAVDWKQNATEVTEIDRHAERMIVDRLTAARPDHAAFGEEHGLVGPEDSPWRWVIDPIDGTSGFVRGIPVWATLIALTHSERGAVLGVVSAPALRRRWWGGAGLGAHVAADGVSRDMRVSTVADLAEAQVSGVRPGGDRTHRRGSRRHVHRPPRRRHLPTRLGDQLERAPPLHGDRRTPALNTTVD